jgi:hypothetical protein
MLAVIEADRRGFLPCVSTQQSSEETPSKNETEPILFEVKTIGSVSFVFG